MSTSYLTHNPTPTTSIQQSIQSLRTELQLSRTQQKRYIIELNTLQSIRSKISTSLEQLSANYKKELKSLQTKVKKLEVQNKQLKNKNSLYEMEIQNFQKRILEKDHIISSILAKDFVAVSRSGSLSTKREETVIFAAGNQQAKYASPDHQKIFEGPEIKNRDQGLVTSRQLQSSDNTKTGFIKKPPVVKKIQQIESFSTNQQNEKSDKKLVESEPFQNPDSQKRDFNGIEFTENHENHENHDLNQKDQILIIGGEQGDLKNEGQTLNEGTQIVENNQALQILTNGRDFLNPFGVKDDQIFIQSEPNDNNAESNPPLMHQISSSEVQRKIPEGKSFPNEANIDDFGHKDVFGQTQPNFMSFPTTEHDIKSAQQGSAKIGNQFPEQIETLQIPIKVPIKKNMPPPPSVKKGPVPSKLPAKKHIKPTKNIPKYKVSAIPFVEEPHEHQFLHPNIVLDQENQLSENQLVQKDQGAQNQPKIQNQHKFQEQTSNNVNNVELQQQQIHQKQNASYSSNNKSKKGKRHQPRPVVEHGLVNFNEDTAPVPQTEESSSNFFEKLACNKMSPLQQQSRTAQPTFTPYFEETQDDHEMHGLVDESSIQQIQDTSMISSTIFAEEIEFGVQRMGHHQTAKRRKGSTDQQKSSFANQQRSKTIENVLTPAPSKKMPKKKAKRETVQVMDPSSFV